MQEQRLQSIKAEVSATSWHGGVTGPALLGVEEYLKI
jgi:hypothetical protein